MALQSDCLRPDSLYSITPRPNRLEDFRERDLVRQKSAAQIEAELEAADAVGALIGELIGGSIGRRR